MKAKKPWPLCDCFPVDTLVVRGYGSRLTTQSKGLERHAARTQMQMFRTIVQQHVNIENSPWMIEAIEVMPNGVRLGRP